MKELGIGHILAAKRREKGVTQDDVAEYAGVSKASVSKWENSQSYPDITILPLLATYYNISIDELLGYRPQLDDREIQKKYREFTRKFAEQPFWGVVDEMHEFIRRYDSCYPLLFSMAQLFLNHYMLAASLEEGQMILEEAKNLCVRIREESRDTLLKKDALTMEALICLMKGDAAEVFSLLGNKVRPVLPTEQFIVGAYQMLGEQDRAMCYTQASIYMKLVELVDYLAIYFTLCRQDQKEAGLTCIRKFAEAFSMEQLLPHKIVGLYHASAVYYARAQEEEKTLNALEEYVHLIEREWKNFSIHGNCFFDQLDDWLDDTGLNSQIPRDLRLVRRDLVAAVEENPFFSFLKGNPRFRTIEKKLQKLLEEPADGKGGKQ